MDVGSPYTSGNWAVKQGSEDAFVSRWTEFAGWSKENAPGAGRFYLLRDSRDPQHFVSFGSWRDPDAVTAWRERPEFADLLGRCRALCEDFEARDYTLVASGGD